VDRAASTSKTVFYGRFGNSTRAIHGPHPGAGRYKLQVWEPEGTSAKAPQPLRPPEAVTSECGRLRTKLG